MCIGLPVSGFVLTVDEPYILKLPEPNQLLSHDSTEAGRSTHDYFSFQWDREPHLRELENRP